MPDVYGCDFADCAKSLKDYEVGEAIEACIKENGKDENAAIHDFLRAVFVPKTSKFCEGVYHKHKDALQEMAKNFKEHCREHFDERKGNFDQRFNGIMQALLDDTNIKFVCDRTEDEQYCIRVKDTLNTARDKHQSSGEDVKPFGWKYQGNKCQMVFILNILQCLNGTGGIGSFYNYNGKL